MKEKINYLSHDFFRIERERAKKYTHIGKKIMETSKQVRVDSRTIVLKKMTDEELAERNKKNRK